MADKLTQRRDRTTSDGTEPNRRSATVSSSTPSSTIDNRGKKKARDGSHGLKFESKLLALFCIRGLSAGYKFELGRENEKLGDKFDDVIFRYEVEDETPAGKHWRYQYVQAKHKENEDERKITANDLIDPNDKAPFGLKKYFLSYCKMKKRGDDVENCIVCTNWGLNEEQFKRIQVEEVKEQHAILKFAKREKPVRIYKLQIDQSLIRETLELMKLLMKLLKKSDIETMKDAILTDNLNEDEIFVPDVTKKDSESLKKFHPNFINDEKLSVGAQEYRHNICKVIDDFYKKLIFVVKMPSEIEFKQIIESEDVSKYYPSNTCKVQTIRIFQEISDAFEKKAADFFLKSEEGKKILLKEVTDASLEYQRQLEKNIGFNEDAIEVMKKKLRVKKDSGNNKVQLIATPSPQHTAVKVISAVQILLRELEQEGNYLVTSSSLLQDEEEMKRWGNILKLQKGLCHFLVIVCDDGASEHQFKNVIADNLEENNNFIIIINHDDASIGKEEEVKFFDLSEYFQNEILSTTVSFQWKNVTVRELVGDKPEEVIDFRSIKELLLEKNKVKIPSFTTSSFEQSLYIPRRLRFPFDSTFELGGKCRIRSNGHIEWLVKEEERKETWKKITDSIANNSSLRKIVQDSHLMTFEQKRKGLSVVVISGVAGSGKSTLLSHCYDEIKRTKPDHWVIKINLVDHQEEIFKLNNFTGSVAAHLLVDQLHVAEHKSSFSRSLLRNRLETGDGIVIMFDGFDEVNEMCQDKVIQLMKAITKEKSPQLYVTTRPHMLDKLQFQLSQLAYSLENFTKNDQIDYLASYWKNELKLSRDNDEFLQKFAESLAERVSETLKDKDKSFIGVPLQCRIIAECFQSKLQENIKQNNENGAEQTNIETNTFNLDLNSLYKLLMETKRRVFREEKINSATQNQILIDAVNRLIEEIESHLTKLAIEALVTDKKSEDILWPLQSSYQLETDKRKQQIKNNELGVKFGLIMFKEGDGEETTKTQFLHRTFAEYLLAKYLYEGISINHCQNNPLLDSEPVRDLIIKKILVEDNYDGVRVFFNAMLNESINSEEWLRIISKDKQTFPIQLQNFTKDVALHITKPKILDSEKLPGVVPRFIYRPNPLAVAVYTGIENLYYFICDCLDIVLEKAQVGLVFRSAFEMHTFSFPSFYFVSSGIFQRFIKYYDDADYLELACITNPMLYGMMMNTFTLESYLSTWNKDNTREIVKMLLDFIEKHKMVYMKEVMSLNEFVVIHRGHTIVQMLHFFTFNEYYDCHFDQFFRLLSSMCLDDVIFRRLLTYTLRIRDVNNNNWAYPQNNGIEKTLMILKKLGRDKVAEGFSHLALVSDKKVFERFYHTSRPNEEDSPHNVQMLLERDSSRMTLLHRAAFYGDTKTVDYILKILIRSDPATIKQLVNSVVRDIIDRTRTYKLAPYERFTPFYVAAARGHKEICRKMLSFLTKIFGVDHKEDLTDYYGIVRSAMWDAILFENLEMFQVILEVVKEEWGRESLLVLLKTENDSYKSWLCVLHTENYNKELLKIKVKVLLENDSKKGYEDMNDLLLSLVPHHRGENSGFSVRYPF